MTDGNEKIKTAFVDFASTISYSRYWGQLADSNHVRCANHPKIIDWITRNSSLLKDWDLGKYNSRELCNFISESTGIQADELYNDLIESCQSMAFITDDIVVKLNALKYLGVKVVLASDHMDLMRPVILRAMGLDVVFDDLLISCEIGCTKKDGGESESPFFEKYMTENGLSPQDVILFDDNLGIIDKYRALGFNTVLISKNNTLSVMLTKIFGI